MRLSETHTIVPFLEPKDLAAGAYVSEAVNVGQFQSFAILITFGAITGNSVLTVNADATAALATALTTPIAFNYRLSAADFKVATADQYGDVTAVLATGLTLTAATFDHRAVLIEFDTVNLAAPWVTINLSAVANPCLVGAFLIGESRYPGHLPPTVV